MSAELFRFFLKSQWRFLQPHPSEHSALILIATSQSRLFEEEIDEKH